MKLNPPGNNQHRYSFWSPTRHDLYNLHHYVETLFLLEKFRETSIVVNIAPFSFLRALNFFKQSTVSCLGRFKSYWFCLPCATLCVSPVEHRGHPLSLADPGMLQSLLCPDSLGRVYCQHLIDQILGLESHIEN